MKLWYLLSSSESDFIIQVFGYKLGVSHFSIFAFWCYFEIFLSTTHLIILFNTKMASQTSKQWYLYRTYTAERKTEPPLSNFLNQRVQEKEIMMMSFTLIVIISLFAFFLVQTHFALLCRKKKLELKFFDWKFVPVVFFRNVIFCP